MLNRESNTKKPTIAILLTGVLLMAGVIVASYIMRNNESHIIDADRFYFTSNFLKDTSENAVYYIDPKHSSFNIQLYNYEDAKRKTEVDIQYSVTAVNGTAFIDESSDNTEGTIKKEDKTATIKVTPGAGENNVKITAESKVPYVKKLTAEFKLENGNSYTVTNEGKASAVLTMICRDAGKDIHISLPENVIPDASDDRIQKGEVNDYIFNSNGYGVYTLVLLKKADSTITEVSNGVFADEIVIKEIS